MTKNLRLLWALLVMAALTAGYLAAKKAGTPSLDASPVKSAPDAADSIGKIEVIAPPEISKPVIFKIDTATLKSSGNGTYPLRQNDAATFLILLPCDGKLTIHGYNKDWPLTANQESILALTAERTGRFPMHVHCKDKSHIEIGTLEVVPKP